MKVSKIICLTLAAITALCASACTQNQKTYTLFSGSYWLSDPSVSEVGGVNETCVYNVEYVPESDSSAIKAEITGTLTTRLTRETYEGVDCYKFTTEVKTSGKYTVNGTDYPVDDEEISECLFLGMKDKLFPIKSSKTVNGITPYKSNDVYNFYRVAYSSSVVYDYKNNKATATLTPDDRSDEGVRVTASERTYDKLGAQNAYFDNESMLMIARACNLEEGFSARFSSIDIIAGKVNTMTLAVNTSSANKEISLKDYVLDGVTVGTEQTPKKIGCFNVNISISGTFSGNPVVLCYASDKENRKRLVEMTTYLPFSAGKLNYRLKSVSTR